MKNKSVRRNLSKATMRIMRTSPFYTSIILKHKFVEDNSVNGMSINGRAIKYNEEKMQDVPVPELAEALKHMAMHIAHKHHVRGTKLKSRYDKVCQRKGASFEQMFSVAADLSINSILKTTREYIWKRNKLHKHMIVPGEGLFTDFEDGYSAEEYFHQILKKMEDKEEDDKDDTRSSPQGGSGSSSEEEKEQEDQSNEETQKEVPEESEDEQKEEEPQETDLGQFELAKPSKVRQAEDEATTIIATAIVSSKGSEKGDVESAKQLIQQNSKPPTVNWRAELSQFLNETSKGKPNFRHANRRIYGGDFIQPTNKDRSPKRAILLLDVSSSMPDDCVAAVFQHIEEILTVKKNMTVELVPFNTGVMTDSIKEYDSTNTPIKNNDRTRAGYGGTLFLPAIKYAESKKPSGIIMLTDLEPADGFRLENHKPSVPWITLSVQNYLHNNKGGNYPSYVYIPKWSKVLEIKP